MANEPSKTPTQATPQMIPLSKLHELPGVFNPKPQDKSLGSMVLSIQNSGVKEAVILWRRKWRLCFWKRKGTGGRGGAAQAGTADRSAQMILRGCSRGLGCYPNKQKLRFPATPGTTVSSLCMYKDIACCYYQGRK